LTRRFKRRPCSDALAIRVGNGATACREQQQLAAQLVEEAVRPSAMQLKINVDEVNGRSRGPR
jgi:hypothetical protein